MIITLAVVLCVGVVDGVALIPVLEAGDPDLGLTTLGPARQALYPEQQDSSASPYWADPEGLASNLPPILCPAHLALSPKWCMKVFGPCDKEAKYRSVSGQCTNLQHPEYGTSGQFLVRLLPSAYDGEVVRSRAVSGCLLPNPRVVSLVIRGVVLPSASQHNLLLMQMGQFIDHDYSITTVVKDYGKMMNCLDCKSWMDPRCIPVPLPKDDPYILARVNNTDERRCLPVTRSVAKMWVNEMGVPDLEHHNMNTAYLDLSQVYGSDECRGEELRFFVGGLLNTSQSGILTQRPASHFPVCLDDSGFCFFSGDDRANENIGLTVLHFVFHREHNRLARVLRIINPYWDDERLYQEARRMNIAQYQHTVYSEYLPAILGHPTTAQLNLLPQQDGYYLGYDEEMNPEVINSFSTAAFRMGHSSIADTLALLDAQYQLTSTIPLVITFHNTSLLLTAGVWDSVLRGLMGSNMMPIDLHLEDTVLNQLFKLATDKYSGQDLAALNIARGRDHGLPSYSTYLGYCGVGNVDRFEDLLPLMSTAAVTALRKAYASVHDIDVFVGGLAEHHTSGGIVGPTFACIISRQFLVTKKSDRFWYEARGSGLTPKQLQSIKTVTLASIICNNLEEVEQEVPLNAYYQPLETNNPLRACSSLPTVDMSLWKDRPGAGLSVSTEASSTPPTTKSSSSSVSSPSASQMAG